MSHRLTQLHLESLPLSHVASQDVEYAALAGYPPRLAVLAPPGGERALADLDGERSAAADGTLLVGPRSPRNLAGLRRRLEWLRPRPLGVRTSAGFGDRLGLATPGHIRALRAVGGKIAPIFAQQSIREMTRTGRAAQDVVDDAVWGAFTEGWREGLGADADHLKTPEDVDRCLAAGFTTFTIDPGEHVDPGADAADAASLRASVAALPWADLEDNEAALRGRYLGRGFDLEHLRIAFDEPTLLRAAAKYGRAVAHVARMERHLRRAAGTSAVEVEVSVDETDTPTTPAEHLWVASELRRLGVRWVSLAPRFIGRFEKGVDYIGDLPALEGEMAAHAALARHLGPYKLSLHSGSDKFSVYPIAAAEARGLVHLKTAGTSWLEALRTVAAVDPALFRAMYAFARERYETDRASYLVSGELGRAPLPADVPEGQLAALLDQLDPRQILHVTFGSILSRFKDSLLGLLRANPEAHARNLEAHFIRHLRPFAS